MTEEEEEGKGEEEEEEGKEEGEEYVLYLWMRLWLRNNLCSEGKLSTSYWGRRRGHVGVVTREMGVVT